MADIQEVERLQFKMQRIRRHMDEDVDRLQADAAQLMDWKYYVRRHPLATMAAISAAGYFLIPTPSPPAENRVYLDPDTSREVAERVEKLHRDDEPLTNLQETRQQGLLLTVGAMAINALLKAGMNYASQQLRATWLQEFQSPPKPRTGSPS